jgi:hypothetical protein
MWKEVLKIDLACNIHGQKWEKWQNRDDFVFLTNFSYIVSLAFYPVNYEDSLLGAPYGVFNRDRLKSSGSGSGFS